MKDKKQSVTKQQHNRNPQCNCNKSWIIGYRMYSKRKRMTIQSWWKRQEICWTSTEEVTQKYINDKYNYGRGQGCIEKIQKEEELKK